MHARPVPRSPARPSLAACVLAACVLAGVVLATAGCTRPASDAPRDATRITVSATAEARRAPDIAVLSTGVVTQAPDANSAIRRNSERMTAVVAALRTAGIAERDVQTSGVSLNPDHHYVANRPPRIRGYFASNTVNVTVREIGRLGDILDALVAIGANQVQGPMFDIEDKDAVLDEARDAAMAKARTRAERYAKRLGLRVRRVVSIDESGGGAMPRGATMDAVAEQAAVANVAMPIAPGQNVMGVTLDVVYELGK